MHEGQAVELISYADELVFSDVIVDRVLEDMWLRLIKRP